MPQTPTQHRVVEPQEQPSPLPVFSLVGFFVHPLWRLVSGTAPEEDADEHGDDGHGHDQRGYQREGATVSESGTKNLEIIPPTRARGRKTAIVVSVDEVMALATSVVPLRADSSGS